jgi:hypothetical protein
MDVVKDLNYWKNNCEEDYLHTPISVLRYISELEKSHEKLFTEQEVRSLLITQRGNSYVAILTKTKDKELASVASSAPEPSGKDGWVKK